MLQDLLFSLDRILPFFLLILLGALLRRGGKVGDGFFKGANTFVFQLALPVNLFCSIAFAQSDLEVAPAFLWYAFFSTLGAIGAIWLATELFFRDKTIVGTLAQGGFRGNYALLGVPLVTAILGERAAGKAALVLLMTIPLYNMLSVVILTLRGSQRGKLQPRKLLRGIVTNPLIVGMALALPVYFLHLSFPYAITQTLGLVGQTATPLGLLAIGGLFRREEAAARLGPTLYAVAIKNVIQPALLVLLSYTLGYRGEELFILFVLYAAPTAVSSYPMAVALGGDPPLAANILIVTTLLSAFVLSVGVYLMRVTGAI